MAKKTQVYTLKQALEKAASYCAYQERCQQEVQDKLLEWGMKGNEADQVIAELITLNFLNEERFAKAYAGGKFRIKKWGRNKIVRELKRRRVSEYCIRKGLQEIEDAAYTQTLLDVYRKKHKETKDTNKFIRDSKVARYLIGRGFESELVWDIIKQKKASR